MFRDRCQLSWKAMLIMSAFLFYNTAFSQLQTKTDPLFIQPIADPAAIPKFINQLPIIPRIDLTQGGPITMYMGTGTHDFGLLPGTPLNAFVFGYNTSNSFGYLGPSIVAKKDNAITIQWVNNLGFTHPLPIDKTNHWAFAGHMGMPPMYTIAKNGVPAVPHLHGGNTESESDGLPEHWWTPLGPNHIKGPDYVKSQYYYENNQDAATIWYHDHVLGITRLNVYMGLAAFYLLRDENELDLIEDKKLPNGTEEIEMVIQDKMFYPNGQLAFPDAPAMNMPGFANWIGGPSIQPEFFGEVITVNGKAWPVLDVKPKKYRFRILNGSDSRFYNLKITPSVRRDNLQWTVIASDQGFLNAPLSQEELLIAPGERYDVVVDFSDPALRGKTLIVRNNAKTPFPKGVPANPQTTGQIMAFRVGNNPVSDNVTLPEQLLEDEIEQLQSSKTRKLLLFEAMDHFGRMQPMLGIVDPSSEYDGTLMWIDPTTEKPEYNSTEIWEVYNATVDAHPIHLHLVKFQILGRQKFTSDVLPKMNMAHDHTMSMGGKLANIDKKGMEKKPELYESGWKDTGIMYPGQVTRIIAKFERLGEYVWHCHILSHEDHEMMRKFEVVPAAQIAVNKETAENFDYSLSQNYPNPFNPVTTIKFSLQEDADVTLKIYTALGEEIGTLLNQQIPKGNHKVEFDASRLNSGMYFYTLTAGSFTETRKMMLIK